MGTPQALPSEVEEAACDTSLFFSRQPQGLGVAGAAVQ